MKNQDLYHSLIFSIKSLDNSFYVINLLPKLGVDGMFYNDMYLIQEPTPMYDYSKEYWCGWMYAYLQWYFNVSFKKLRNYIDMNDLQKLYPTLHEVSLHKAISTIKKYITNKNMPTNLQRLRLNHNISQSKLAEVSGVSLRMIQQYEQKQKDINKASVSSLYELAKALDCDIEDIMELNIDN